MGSSVRSRLAARLRRPAILGIFLAALVHTGCRSAAAVFLDLPPATTEAEQETQERKAAAAPIAAPDTVREIPPAERVTTPDSALALLPRAPDGGVDWVAAIESGTISPRSRAAGKMPVDAGSFGFDFYFGSFEALFPHSGHVGWLDCDACHPAIYRTRSQGPSLTSMTAISNGESCGVCHGRVAFGVDVCERCHPQAEMPADRLEATLGPTIRLARDSMLESTYPRSVFSHGLHRIRYRCSACHAEPYAFEAGAGTARMADLQAGDGCGSCHDGKVAFGLVTCTRCHVSEDAADPES